ncbi:MULTISPECIES: hypothetical protein [Rhodococcus]|uniref:hypothetical protein n=1 Tax=Rhodococcus TaxID=1827 RepID=UPI0020173190|nr:MULTISPECIES: hypothetical protein [Rhodococcus]MDV8107379.1 hypothetical protein [Rhodococcus sp. IEGM 69]MDV7242237.1 hypothetical protein [Rhodococcus oxybenzonivorans]MDV7276268.1 hypothetical protein [Rhodococcus oxybenzonivorans]MDV7331725.1 hypothetical protein [Rhodococcus oxybenzonivorans]MDV7343947.1 hypothetical protein [Rhodococcus oxybenzonivorans]
MVDQLLVERVIELLLEVGIVLEMATQCVACVVRSLSEVETVSGIARVRNSFDEKSEILIGNRRFHWSKWTA